MDASDVLARFLAAIAANEEENAEALTQTLSVADEPALIDLARSHNPDRRWWAVRALAQIGTADAINAIMVALVDTDSAVRAAGALAAAHLHQRYPYVVQPVLGQLATLLMDEDGLVRQAAADSLALCGDNAVDVLAAVLAAQHGGARARASLRSAQDRL